MSQPKRKYGNQQPAKVIREAKSHAMQMRKQSRDDAATLKEKLKREQEQKLEAYYDELEKEIN